MKSYSADAVTKADIDAIANMVEVATEAHDSRLSETDQKQTRQIMTLRWVVGISFVVNAALAIGLRFI